MKKHLLITAALLLTSCRSSKQAIRTTDTVYIAKYHYDSIFIDHQTLTTYSHDTVYVDRWQTEYRYRLHTDTLHNYHTDTITITIVKEASNKNYDMLPWVIIGEVLVGGQLVKKQIKKIF
jgi:uncharacterized protein YcfL